MLGDRVDSFAATWGTDGVLYLSGELDIAYEDDVRAALENRWDGTRELIIDLSRLVFLDSTGVKALANVSTRFEAGRVLLRSPDPRVLRVLELLGCPAWPNVAIQRA
jgi:anti-anti-sigma factor